MDVTFDYVIVGAGSSGATLANRLSADPSVRVCLVEAGPKDSNSLIHMPLGVMFLMKNRRLNWLYNSTPQEGLAGREVSIPRGKVLGGSSAINGMIYIRGHRADYDAWADAGCDGWAFEDVLPYFKRAEANTDQSLDDRWHGRSGPLSVTDLKNPNPMDQVFVDAARQLQIRADNDFNSPEPEGVGVYQVTQKDGKRHSSAAAYLSPIRNRENLTIITKAEVTGLIFKEGRVVGVNLRKNDGSGKKITVSNEVVLCAGAIGSPDILLRSGIGGGEQIRALGQEVVCDLPGVGQNLQEHVDVMVISKSRSTKPYGISLRALPRLTTDAFKWFFANSGMFSSNMVEAGGFVRSDPSESRPDIQFTFIPGLKSHRGRLVEYGHGVSLHACVLRPESRGSVTRKTMEGPPDIDLGLLKEETDLIRLTKGARLSRDILSQSPFHEHGLSEVLPGERVQSEDEWRDFVRQNARTIYHPVGTCSMGTGNDAVVDPELRVRGVKGLRIADASIMPRIVSGNTNAPAIMIAEKAADMILNDRRAA